MVFLTVRRALPNYRTPVKNPEPCLDIFILNPTCFKSILFLSSCIIVILQYMNIACILCD